MLFNKLTLISIAAIISIASILVFIIPTDSIETQSLINNETQSVINSENPPINHTLSLDQSISVSEANNRVAINLFKLLENDTKKNIFFSPFSILTAMTIPAFEILEYRFSIPANLSGMSKWIICVLVTFLMMHL